jgi:predicted ATPase
VGKTRLALAGAAQLPDRFPDGVIIVDLTPVRDPHLVLPTIAQALGLIDTGRSPLSERLRAFLREREAVLMVLDNFEQVLPAAASLADLLASCPGLVLLVTSRVPLHLRWEQALRVAPLPIPDLQAALPPLDAVLAVPSVELLVGRARARRADFALSE